MSNRSATAMPFAGSADSPLPLSEQDGQPFGPARLSHQPGLFTPLDSATLDSDSTAISEESPSFPPLTSSPEDSHVRTSASPANEPDWMASEVAFSLSSYEFWRSLGLRGSYLRTSMRCYRALTALEAETSVSCWPRWLSAGIASPGGFSTVAISDSPNDVRECSLSDIQLTGDVPRRFFLSQRAAAGILRRAEKRGVKIAEPIWSTLCSLAAGVTDSDLKRFDLVKSLALAWRRVRTQGRVPSPSWRTLSRAAARMGLKMERAADLPSSRTRRSRLGHPTSVAEGRAAESLQFSYRPSRRAAVFVLIAGARGQKESSLQPSAQVTHTGAEATPKRKRTISLSQERSPLQAVGEHGPKMPEARSLRRLTPLEWERLQGFPDHWTCVKSAPKVQTRPAIEESETPSRSPSSNGSSGESMRNAESGELVDDADEGVGV